MLAKTWFNRSVQYKIFKFSFATICHMKPRRKLINFTWHSQFQYQDCVESGNKFRTINASNFLFVYPTAISNSKLQVMICTVT